MRKFFKTEPVVKKILEDMPITRTSDNLLYAEYWKRTAPEIDFFKFFLNSSRYNGASYKHVERVRRRLQNKYPELIEISVAEARFEESLEYENYAING